MANKPALDTPRRWSIGDSSELYSIERWSDGFFSISDRGTVQVNSNGDGAATSVDLKGLVDDIVGRGIELPLLLRFSDILRARIERLNGAFAKAIDDYGYRGHYRGVFPIKVNQARTLVEEIVEFGRPFHYGLEAGSKPELIATMALHKDRDALIICNGYKDDEYVRMALMASLLGPTVVLVAEKPSEIDRIHRIAKEMQIRPSVGIRVKLSSPGAGKWQQSGGDLSKFGLSPAEMIDAVAKLREWGELDCFRLLHFHLGSQVSAIRSIKNALREAGRFYVELRKLECHALDYLDVGGGLGVDYDGSQTNFASSRNYSIQEYANDVVYEVQQICDAEEVPHPNLVSESGRAISAHHSVLIVDVLEVSRGLQHSVPDQTREEDVPAIVGNLVDTFQGVNRKNALESFHDAVSYRDQALQLFNLGHLGLEHRVRCDRLFWATCRRVLALTRELKYVPEDLQPLERLLSDTYFLNFSLFQSLPDSWAVDQLFPIMPIHRLDEEPRRRGVLADITCDSDGCIDQFIDLRDVKKVLELHPMRDGERYYLGIFLVGAYQEILGDLHNLFGDTNTVHVAVDENGRYGIKEVFPGDTLTDVLRYVNYSPEGLISRMRQSTEEALRDGRITLEQSKMLMTSYRAELNGYTYLSGD